MENVKRNVWQYVRLGAACLGVVGIMLGVFSNSLMLASFSCMVVAVVFYFSQRSSRLREAWINHYMDTVVRNIERANNYAVQRIPVGIAVFDKEGKLQWKNKLFMECLGRYVEDGDPMDKVLPPPDNKFATLSLRDAQKQVKIGDRSFNMLVRRVQTTENAADDTGVVIYMLDITDRERQKRRYEEERSCIAYIQLDNYSDVMKGLNESERANLSVEVTKAIANWADEKSGLFLKYADDLYLVAMSRKGMADTIAKKFEVLDLVREIKVGNKIAPTISIGMSGEEKTLTGLSQKAQSYLDLALGRGGDQAVIAQSGGEVQFFGAKGSVQAKNTRVRARIVAQAIHELMVGADNVFIMGHVNEDYDALGASLGVAKMAMALEKECYIVSSGQGSSLARMEEVSKAERQQYLSIVVGEDEALKHVKDGSLLVMVDHHRTMLSASLKIFQAIRKRVVIDHHRRAEDAIKDVILQYMEPSTSSTSELVTEMLQYFDDRMQFTTVEATALYAGIIVDTKNFAVQTGERTFEAAAFLRRNGADPKLVTQLFKDDEATVLNRARLITEMQTPIQGLAYSIYRNAPAEDYVTTVVAQTADELLTMDDISVSVVLSESDKGVGISARSDGTINVQTMMEELGGGGHQTVAGVQLKDTTADELVPKIIALAKKQLEERDKDESNSTSGR